MRWKMVPRGGILSSSPFGLPIRVAWREELRFKRFAILLAETQPVDRCASLLRLAPRWQVGKSYTASDAGLPSNEFQTNNRKSEGSLSSRPFGVRCSSELVQSFGLRVRLGFFTKCAFLDWESTANQFLDLGLSNLGMDIDMICITTFFFRSIIVPKIR